MTEGRGLRRRFKWLAGRVLPELIKRRIRGRFFGYRPAGASLGAVFVADEQGTTVTLDGGITLRFGVEDRAELQYHFVDNGASVEELAAFLALARPAHLLFDVGAAKSLFAVAFCAGGPDKRAVALEPSPVMMEGAARLVALNGLDARIDLRPCAAGDAPGHVPVRIYRDGFVSTAPDARGGRAIDVEVTTIDAEAERVGGDPDLIKIDVEGYEHEVLVGARQVLRRRRPPISFELHLDLLERRGIPPSRVTDELLSHGYRFEASTGRPLRPAEVSDSVHSVLRFIAI